MSAVPGICRVCGLRREVFKIDRRSDVASRTSHRVYRSSICGDCALALHEGGATARFDRLALALVAAYARAIRDGETPTDVS